MRLISVLGGIAALLVAMILLMYVVSPSSIRATPGAGAVTDGAAQPNEPVDGKYRVNPFELSETGPFPKAQIESQEYNFGRMATGETGRHKFVITNGGEAPLKLARGESTCKCTVGTLGLDEVPPGKSTEVEMEWHPPGATMEFSQSAVIWTNDPQQPEIRLSIAGQVVPEVMTYPEGVWLVGPISEQSPNQVKGLILSMLEDKFEITAIETSQPWITVTARPLPAEEAQQNMGKSGYELICEVQPAMPVGTFNEKVTVKTTLPRHEEFQFEITGNRMGPFHVIGPGWFAGEQVLRLGRVSAADGKVVKLSLFATDRDPPLEVDVEAIEPPLLNVTFDPKAAVEGTSDRVRFSARVEVPRGITPGRYVDDNRIQVRIKTNHPDAPLVRLNVELQAD